MKKVLIPLAVKKARHDSVAEMHFVRETYLQKLMERDILPIFTSAVMSDEMLDSVYNECDGALFLGGTDFNPENYGQERHEKTETPENERDKMELYLLAKILKDKKPYLGICRGCQALGIASGGKLIQHIPDLNVNENHDLGENALYQDLFTGPRHIVEISLNSKAFKLIGSTNIETNTAHHQAVQNVGNDFVISGKTAGGIIEIIEHKDQDYFCFGFQCHPEAMVSDFAEKIWDGFAFSL